MPQINGDFVFKVTHVQSKSGGQQVLNIYHYHFPDLPLRPDSQAVAEAFDAEMVPVIAAIQSVGVVHERIDVELLGSLTDFYSMPTTVTNGDLSGEALPVFNAFRFDYIRSTKETRSGSKRICGILESQVSGDFLDATAQAAADVVAGYMESPITPGIFSVSPVIVGIRYDKSEIPWVELPVSQWVYNPVAGVIANSEVTTQNSRKRGRGA